MRGVIVRDSVILQLVFATIAAAALPAPANLTVGAATNKRVPLTWQSSGPDANQYVVERRTLDGTTFGAIATIVPDINKVLATTFTDTAFDPFTAYIYRVRAVNTLPLISDTSDPGNEVTVGPPPYGYTRVIPPPDKLDDPSNVGRHTQLVLDASGDPML